jgi:hypothetical protein
MGQEANCFVQSGGKRVKGKAMLETTELLFRPPDSGARVKIPFAVIKRVKAVDGELHVETADGLTVFELGAAAEKWCDKILHPKPRAEKLGVKAGANVSVLGEFEADFLRELRGATQKINNDRIDAASELIFLGAESAKELTSGMSNATKAMKGATALWIVYPKGKKEITENDVIAAGRKFGLKDVKVVGFSPTHTALKFVIPVARRTA